MITIKTSVAFAVASSSASVIFTDHDDLLILLLISAVASLAGGLVYLYRQVVSSLKERIRKAEKDAK